MSYSTTAILFYGFPVNWDTDDINADSAVDVAHYGDGRTGVTPYLFIRASRSEVEDGDCRRVTSMAVPPDWDLALRSFTEQNGLAWPADGAGWHLTLTTW